MSRTELISATTIKDLNRVDFTFKDERLIKSSQRILAIFTDAAKYAEAKNREVSKILGDVAEKKSYVKDGFTSVADYATKVFGISRQNAYALANAGKVYSDPKASEGLKALSPSKLAEVASLDRNKVEEAIKAGAISKDTTQKELREFAEAHKATDPSKEGPVIVDTYRARPCVLFLGEDLEKVKDQALTIEEWDKWFSDFVAREVPAGPAEIVKLSKGKADPNDKKATLERRLYFNRGYSIVVEYQKYYKTAPKKAAKAPKFTKEQLQKMLRDLEEAESAGPEGTI